MVIPGILDNAGAGRDGGSSRRFSGGSLGGCSLSSLLYIWPERNTGFPHKLGSGCEGATRRGVVALEDLITILIVEDDHSIQGLVEDALIEGGFEVAIAASGEEAVTLLQGIKGKYRALVIDINLIARMDGWEVAKRAREIDQEFPVIYMTGARADQWGSHGVPNSILLVKPFATAQLVTAVSQLLNAGSAPPN